jgi:VIT1/CCC1 family predicted Fe2+/Mn2+ transporter
MAAGGFGWRRSFRRPERETLEVPEREAGEVAGIFRGYGLDEPTVDRIVWAIRADRQRWVDFKMRFELQLEEPDPMRARWSAATIGGAYVVGGLIPLAPDFFLDIPRALGWSVALTLLALLVFGYVKGRFTTARPWRSALQTVTVGGLAAATAYGVARLIG